MDWLDILLTALPGSMEETLAKLVEKLNELRDATGMIPDENLPQIYDWIQAHASGIDMNVIANGVKSLINVLEGKNWGPPNPGAGGVV